MKKLISFVLFLSAVTVYAEKQDQPSPKGFKDYNRWSLGVGAGYSAAGANLPDSFDDTRGWGLNLMGGYQISPVFGIELGWNYRHLATRTSENTENILWNDITAKKHLNYLTFRTKTDLVSLFRLPESRFGDQRFKLNVLLGGGMVFQGKNHFHARKDGVKISGINFNKGYEIDPTMIQAYESSRKTKPVIVIGLGLGHRITNSLSAELRGEYMTTTEDLYDGGVPTGKFNEGWNLSMNFIWTFGRKGKNLSFPPAPSPLPAKDPETEEKLSRLEEQVVRLQNRLSRAISVKDTVFVESAPTAIASFESTPLNDPAASELAASKFPCSIYFAIGKETFDEQYHLCLDNLAVFIKDNPGITIGINAYTDKTGSLNFNSLLAKKRADNVIKYFEEKHGIPASTFLFKYQGQLDGVRMDPSINYTRRLDFEIIK